MKSVFLLSLWFCLSTMAPYLHADQDLEQAQQAVEAAAARYEESSARGHAWLKTQQHLEQARAALANDNYALAVREADRAIALAEASIAQADAEANAWLDRFPTVPFPTVK